MIHLVIRVFRISKHARKAISRKVGLIPLLICTALTSVYASAYGSPLDRLEQTPIPTTKSTQGSLIKVINYEIDKGHYLSPPLDDLFSEKVFDRYLNQLDPDKLFFLQADIDQFNRVEYELDDHIKQGTVDVPFLIFSVYRKRVDERVEYALQRLHQPFDFDLDEYYEVDREDVNWAIDHEELDDIWRKRIKNDLLVERLIQSRNQKKKPEKSITETLEQRYTHIARRVRQLKSEDVFQSFINAYARTIEPHSAYFTPRVAENFKIEMRLSLEGIGAVLQTDNEYTLINRVIAGGPADLDGTLMANDRIIGVGQGTEDIVDVIGWRLDDVVDLIRGPKGTNVRLKFLPGSQGEHGDPEIVTITRNEITLEDRQAKKEMIEIGNDENRLKIGVIDLPTFYHDFDGRQNDPNYRSTTRDVQKLIDEFESEGIDGLLLDLRGNGGGALPEAISLAGLFIPQGPIVQTRFTHGHTRVAYDPDPLVGYSGPMAVLVDRYSASASEIFAGAIQDYGRGLVIGETTFGKGTVQTLITLGNERNLGQLKITPAQFFRVNGESTQHRGVVPDIIWYTSELDKTVGERALENSIPWRQISRAKYLPFLPIEAVNSLEFVRDSHQAGIDDHPEFTYLKKITTLNNETRKKTEISLNEAKRRAERTTLETKTLAVENERRLGLGKQPFASIEDLDEHYENKRDKKDKDEDEPDAFVVEGAHILADYYFNLDRSAYQTDFATKNQNQPSEQVN